MKDFLTAIVTPLLSQPSELRIEQIHDNMGILLMVNVAKDDMGTVIGKSGETSKAIRTIMRVYGAQRQARVSVKFQEPEGHTFRGI